MKLNINTYVGLMMNKILFCNALPDVVSIIDNKIRLVKDTNMHKEDINEFIDDSIINLKNINQLKLKTIQLLKIKAAIYHLQILKIRNKKAK